MFAGSCHPNRHAGAGPLQKGRLANRTDRPVPESSVGRRAVWPNSDKLMCAVQCVSTRSAAIIERILTFAASSNAVRLSTDRFSCVHIAFFRFLRFLYFFCSLQALFRLSSGSLQALFASFVSFVPLSLPSLLPIEKFKAVKKNRFSNLNI